MGWFPFFKQKCDYSCGPSSLEMVFRFFGEKLSQQEIMKIAKTSKKEGTAHSGLIFAARKQGFYCYVHEDSSLHQIEHFVRTGYPVIVNYIEPKTNEGHYSVVVGFSRSHLMLNDPWDGAEFVLNKHKFESLWHSGDKKSLRWMLVLSKKAFNLGRQYSPL